jgi:hypothetical protein
MSKQEASTTPGREPIASVRIRTGGVHYNGARIITTLTTDKTATNIAGSNVIVCEEIKFHPAGIAFIATPNEGGGSHVIPYVNVEIVTLA